LAGKMSQYCYTRRAVVTGLPACGCLPLRPRTGPSHVSRLAVGSRVHRTHAPGPQRARKDAAFTTASSVTQTASVFPAGRKQARVKLPACILKVAAQEVLQQLDFEDKLSEAIAGGLTGVLLADASGSDGAALYEAACKLKAQLRGRAVLLIADRSDIVDAAEADGVIMSSKGETSTFC